MANANHTHEVQSDELTPEQLAEIERDVEQLCADIFTPEFYAELTAGVPTHMAKQREAEQRALAGV